MRLAACFERLVRCASSCTPTPGRRRNRKAARQWDQPETPGPRPPGPGPPRPRSRPLRAAGLPGPRPAHPRAGSAAGRPARSRPRPNLFDAAAFGGFKRSLTKGGHPLMSLVPFDDRDGWIWLDGQFVPWREAKVHVLTHGPALCVVRVRRRAHVRRGDLRADGAYRASVQVRGDPGPSKSRSRWPRSTRPARDTCARNGLTDAYVRPIAWRGLGDDRGLGPEHQDPRGHRRVGLAELLQPGRTGQGTADVLGEVQAPVAGDRAGARQGRRPLHDLHHLQARRGEGRVQRRDDARLSGLCRREHRAPTCSSSRTA